MAKIQRGNVVLRVKDEEVQRYMTLGYNLVDEDGNILQAAIPNDFGVLRKAYIDHTAKIAELEETVAKLTKELADANNKAKSRKKSDEL